MEVVNGGRGGRSYGLSPEWFTSDAAVAAGDRISVITGRMLKIIWGRYQDGDCLGRKALLLELKRHGLVPKIEGMFLYRGLAVEACTWVMSKAAEASPSLRNAKENFERCKGAGESDS
jgi:hypothetical protein